jgi:hypothetical protein
MCLVRMVAPGVLGALGAERCLQTAACQALASQTGSSTQAVAISRAARTRQTAAAAPGDAACRAVLALPRMDSMDLMAADAKARSSLICVVTILYHQDAASSVSCIVVADLLITDAISTRPFCKRTMSLLEERRGLQGGSVCVWHLDACTTRSHVCAVSQRLDEWMLCCASAWWCHTASSALSAALHTSRAAPACAALQDFAT